jgi:phage terminase large subunit
MGKRELIIPYAPRKEQMAIHNTMGSHRFAVVVAHRRLGKTVAAVNHLVRAAIENRAEAPRYAYIAPTYGQAKRIAWDYLLKYTEPLEAAANVSELRVDFWGRRIQLAGSDSPDSLRGQGFDGVVLDEFGDQNPRIWSEIIRPALADKGGWALFLGTPKGANHFKDMRDRAEDEADWTVLEFKASETGILSREELAQARREMGDDKWLQEFECSFTAAVEGSYYGSVLNDLEQRGRLCRVERDDLCRTFTAWDLGVGDSTAIWVAQATGQEVRLVDFVENHGVGLDWYVNWLRDRKWQAAEHILPHDVQVRELTSGKSRKEVLEDAGLSITVAPRLSIDDGIQAVRRLLPRCWFNVPAVRQGYDALANYRREYDDKRNVFYDKPLHDWASHASDAFRYLATGMQDRSTASDWSKPLAVNTSWVV